MKIGFYDPFLDAFGGGERYTLTLASHWSKKNTVHVFWNSSEILAESSKRFNLQLENVKTVENVFAQKSLMRKIWVTGTYDLLFVLSDGSIPTVASRRAILHFQNPLPIPKKELWKSMRYKYIVCNSHFTKKYVDTVVGVRSSVIYPPVETTAFKPVKKEKIILSVGRFSSHHSSKKYEILIDAFRRLGNSGWKFVVAGSLKDEDTPYLQMLEKKAKGLHIELLPNCGFTQLKNLYAKASVYWHAAGYHESDPTLMEHFGITTVEAMASGCIPVSFNAGGQTEIISHGENGFLWNTPDELISYTTKITSRMRIRAMSDAKKFDTKHFLKAFDEII